MAIVLAGCHVDWLQVGFDSGHTGYNDGEHDLTVDNVDNLSQLWSTDLLEIATAPAVRGGNLYVTTGGFPRSNESSDARVDVRAFDTATGTTTWTTNLLHAPDCSDLNVQPPNFADAVIAEDSLWTGYLLLGEAEDGGCGGYQNPVQLDPDDGAVVSSGDDIAASAAAYDPDGDAFAQLFLRQTPALAVRIQVGGPNFDWTGVVPGAPSALEVPPTARAGMVFAAHENSVHSYMMYGCGSDPCSPVYSLDLGNHVTTLVDPPSPGALYAASGSDLTLIDRPTGQHVTLPMGAPISGLAWANETLYVAAGTTLQAFHSAGMQFTPLWTAPLGANASASPVVAGGVVYVGESSGAIETFAAAGCGGSSCTALGSESVAGEVDHVTVAKGRMFAISQASPTASRLTVFAPT